MASGMLGRRLEYPLLEVQAVTSDWHDLSSPWAELSPDGSLLLTVECDGERWKLWDSNALEVFGEPLRKKGKGGMGEPLRWGRCDTPEPTATFSPCGKKFAIASRCMYLGITGSGVYVFDTASGAQLLTIEGSGSACLSFSADGARLTTTGDPAWSQTPGWEGEYVPAVCVWESGEEESQTTFECQPVFQATFSPTDPTVLASGGGGGVKIWDATTSTSLFTFLEPDPRMKEGQQFFIMPIAWSLPRVCEPKPYARNKTPKH